MIEVNILNAHQSEGKWIVTFRYWVKGDCACGAIKAKRTFDTYPTVSEIKKAI